MDLHSNIISEKRTTGPVSMPSHIRPHPQLRKVHIPKMLEFNIHNVSRKRDIAFLVVEWDHNGFLHKPILQAHIYTGPVLEWRMPIFLKQPLLHTFLFKKGI
jgi:hypothetical protein